MDDGLWMMDDGKMMDVLGETDSLFNTRSEEVGHG